MIEKGGKERKLLSTSLAAWDVKVAVVKSGPDREGLSHQCFL